MHRESRNDSASFLRFSECIVILSQVDSELSFEQQMALHALETAVLCLFPNPYTHLNLKQSFIKFEKVEANYKGVHSGLCVIKAF